MKMLVILQCEYCVDGKRVARKAWLHYLWLSHTGKRLSEMLPEGPEYFFINASPEVGLCPSVAFPPDLEHLSNKIVAIGPDTILACGRVAQTGLEQLGIPHLAVPHPAWRQLSKRITAEIHQQIANLMTKTG